MISFLVGIPRRLVAGLILIYQKLVSPNLGPNCRFQPTCSQYALEAVQRHGVMRGGVAGHQADREVPSAPRRGLRPRSRDLE